jgi:predicted Fe-S protein YdhL (DUF1289 family)
LIKESPGGALTPRGANHRRPSPVIETSVQDQRTARMCRVLREAEERYRNELMDDEERQLLLDRIKRLRRRLEA